MSSLDLELEVPTESLAHKTFHILHDFLQPDTASTLETTAQSILDLLPENAPYGHEVWILGETCIEIAEQIPYHHPSQLKLAALLDYIGMSPKLGKIGGSATEMITWQYFRYQRLGESIRDNLDGPDPDRPMHYVNFHAFVANLDERRIFRTDPSWAIWAQREAHEERLKGPASTRDEYVLAAAQWILWYGQSFFKEIIYSREADLDTLRGWTPGPLYNGTKFLSLHRWRFWRDRYNAVASGGKEDENGFGQECKTVAAKAAEMMDSLEKNMTF